MAIRKGTVAVVIVIVAGIGYYTYSHFFSGHAGGGMPGGMGSAPPVSVAEAIERDVQQWNEFSGRLVAVNQADIRPRVSGTIDKVHFQEGANVKKGDLLFTIDPRPYEAILQAAVAHAAFAESEFVRAGKLLKDKAIAQREYDQKKNDAAIAKAELATARLNFDYTHIKSPISGRAGRAEITEGNLVESGGNAPVLTRIVANSPIYADFDVDENAFLTYVRVGKHTKQVPVMMGLSTEEGTPHKGHIQSFDNRLDAGSGTIRVRAVFANTDGSLVPGLFARMHLGSAGDTKTVLISDRAVGTDQDKKFVLVVGDDNKVAYREVKLGGVVDGLRAVRDGLKPGEKIIVSGTQRAHPGQAVQPEVVPMEEKEADAAAPKKS